MGTSGSTQVSWGRDIAQTFLETFHDASMFV
jgi:hypothetical protein